ncbi:MAG: chemotaxis protein CheX [Clostridiaceae bacterium]|nr:chemotaxis protein CheX [Clostridiaceae bacterium]
MKAEHVNPFIISVCKIMKDMCMLDLKIGKPSISNGNYQSDASIIKLGLLGALTGEVVLNFSQSAALEIVSKMMMTPVQTIDDLGKSAISELGNMIAGNAATVFANSNLLIDITTPSYYLGSEYKTNASELFSIPFSSESGDLTVDIFIQE